MSDAPLIVWFRHDLRLTDNPAMVHAAATGRPIVPVYIFDESDGAARRWWLHHSLTALAADLRKRGATLVLRQGDAARHLDALIDETAATAVYWNRVYEPVGKTLGAAVKAALSARGVEGKSFNATLLFEPDAVATKAGAPFKVYTPFWKACRALAEPAQPLPPPKRLNSYDGEVKSDALNSWMLLPTKPDWAAGLRETWTPGEVGARERLDVFVSGGVTDYAVLRNRPDRPGTSCLSPHLAFGEIGPRQIWHAVRAAAGTSEAAERFIGEIGWREFNHHLLHHFPQLSTQSLRVEFQAFPWATDRALLQAWQRGRTGFPIVDAGMRELWRTGWMHNRVRMVVASFLVKDLLQRWQDGADWFMDTLVDADLANNAGNWQWTAGCGADAAPYFRVFNPTLQGERFDPHGNYVRRYVPELATLPDEWIHKPAQAPDDVLAKAGVILDQTYPRPVVDHRVARERALDAYAKIRGKAA